MTTRLPANRGQFPCPHCGANTSIIESRQLGTQGRRRRRVCLGEKHRFTTMERVEMFGPTGRPPPDDPPPPAGSP